MFISFSQIFLHPFHFANATHHGKYQTYQFSRSSFPKKYISGPQKKNEYYHNIPRVFPVSKRTNKLPHRIQHI